MFMERVQKIVWVPPNYCNAVACSYAGGTLSLWEEIVVSTLELGIITLFCLMILDEGCWTGHGQNEGVVALLIGLVKNTFHKYDRR
ncbi:hypothetical protein RHGRI_029818 [Rhododendron griersonianum]|uniref:Uncharacterized protein n=1 Tax=Rhododendron griersonianum TaxID=479676 RepID=A0AAV6IKM5_9ERIC|nr:hypothetical protein RHGRI_029818 [Rhododendron griersonianum]